MLSWKDRRVAFLGYGVDVQDVEMWLRAQGAHITLLDEKERPDAFSDLTSYDVLVRSPGVYRYRPEILAAERAGVMVTSKMKIFFEVCPTRNIIGVTGTKGKGTTSTLITEMLRAGGKHVVLGGNIGTGVFSEIPHMTPDSYVVLELSSFQLIDVAVSPHIAVVLMVTADHLDWHTDVAQYVAAKSSIARFQHADDVVVFNDTYPASREIANMSSGKKISVNRACWNIPVKIRGDHHRENFAAAAAVAREVGIAEEVITRVAQAFTGLPHRLSEVDTVAGVTYFDDSIATTPDAALAAIAAFTEPTIALMGGSEKQAAFEGLASYLARAPHVKAVVLMGQTAERLAAAFAVAGVSFPVHFGGKSMAEAFACASSLAQPGDVVVLAPACASFDMFANYKDRGEQFCAQVRFLKEKNEVSC